MKRIASVVFLALILSSCRTAPLPVETPTPDNCSAEDLTEFITTMDDLAQRFDDLAQVAEDTPAENLRLVIEEMQSVELGVKNIDTPPCALRTKAALENYTASEAQCVMLRHSNAILKEVLKEVTRPPRKIDWCNLASDQLEYYNTQMDELKVLLSEKN